MLPVLKELPYDCLHECFLAIFWHDENDVIGAVSLCAECFPEKLIDGFVGLQAKDILTLILLEANLLVVLVLYVVFEGLQEMILEKFDFLDAAEDKD